MGQTHRSEVGEQAKLFAQTQQRGALGTGLLGNRRVAVGQADRAEQNGVRRPAQGEGRLRERLAGLVNAGPAHGGLGDGQFEAEGVSVARNTWRASRMTSGPMPSPANAAILYSFIDDERPF